MGLKSFDKNTDWREAYEISEIGIIHPEKGVISYKAPKGLKLSDITDYGRDGEKPNKSKASCAIFDVIERAFWQGRKCVKHQDFEDWFTDDIKEEIKKHVL